jgi:hypothetical protein
MITSETLLRLLTIVVMISSPCVFICMFIFNTKIMLLQRKKPNLLFRDIAWSGDRQYKNIHWFGKFAVVSCVICISCVIAIKVLK